MPKVERFQRASAQQNVVKIPIVEFGSTYRIEVAISTRNISTRIHIATSMSVPTLVVEKELHRRGLLFICCRERRDVLPSRDIIIVVIICTREESISFVAATPLDFTLNGKLFTA